MPVVESATKMKMRVEYGIEWMKYGAVSFTHAPGTTSARRTTDLGTEGPTRSRAAERIMT
jgi:hypothetical protein